MVRNITQAEMAVGEEGTNEYVVVVMANGGVEEVKGPMGAQEARALVAREKMDKMAGQKYNTVKPDFFMRPLVSLA